MVSLVHSYHRQRTNAKMSHVKTLGKGKATAAIAGLGYSGVTYCAAWNTLVTIFRRRQTIVNAQMKQSI